MAPIKHKSDNHHRSSSKDSGDDDEPSNNLWVGNLSSDTVDSDLMALFSKYGALDSITTYSSRSFAFVYFMHPEDAKASKDSLQSVLVRGNPIKIEFARPAKPGKNVWIGGISSSVTKEQLENEFSKFGKIEDFKFIRDRNSALVDYYKIEDAVAAVKNMNGKRFGGEQIRVDYVRSQPSRRDMSEHTESRDGHFGNKRTGPPDSLLMSPDARGFPETSHGHKRPLQTQTSGGRREGQPSKVLWIGYPPSVKVDEQMLHNSMILFGEIERIRTFPSRNYSFVEFRSIDEARRAKEGLQGRLFNDPRIQILFSNSELTPSKGNPPLFAGLRGPRPDIFFNEPPFGPMDLFGSSRLMANNYIGPMPPNAMAGATRLMRPFGPQGFDPIHGGSESFHDGLIHNFPDGNLNSPMNMNWRRLSPPAPGMLRSSPGMHPTVRPLPGLWDGLDIREMKRSRVDVLTPLDDVPFHQRRMDVQGTGSPFGFHQPYGNVIGQSQHSPVGVNGPYPGPPDSDHCWRGIIAKGGTPVCHARCVPVGKGIDSPFPEIVNCSARTGLDMLAKHYVEAIGFDIVFFLPDSEEDFASYTEFLRYLGGKDRAGVAKLDDGTTLFLVPPSDFLTKVLNISGPERLYGVVLNLPQQSASAAMQQPQLAIPPSASQFNDRPQLLPPLQSSYSMIHQNEEQTLKMQYARDIPEELMPGAGGGRPLVARADELHTAPTVSMDYISNPTATSQVEVSLTPDLIATLASLIPTNNQSSSSGHAQFPLCSSARPPFDTAMPEKSLPPQGWSHDNQAPVIGGHHQEQMSHPSQQLGHQLFNQAPVLSQFLAYTNIANGTDHSAQPILGSTYVQDAGLNVQQAAAGPNRQLNDYVIPSQGFQFADPQSNQQYQLDASFSSHNSYGIAQTTDASGMFHTPVPQPQKSSTAAAPIQSGSVPQNQIAVPLASNKMHTEFPTQAQQLQTAIAGSAQGTSEDEGDKNQRYQSTLQFAASLLLQIQQQQQSAHAAHGSGNQQ